MRVTNLILCFVAILLAIFAVASALSIHVISQSEGGKKRPVSVYDYVD